MLHWKRYLNMNAENENADENVNSNKKRIYRKNVACLVYKKTEKYIPLKVEALLGWQEIHSKGPMI